MNRLLVEHKPPLPDFRVVVSFLWGGAHPVDTEGDCRWPADRDWTELHVRSRTTNQVVDVLPADGRPGVLAIESEWPELVARVALFLAIETGGAVSDEAGGRLDTARLSERTGSGFSIDEASRRAQATRFRHATEEDPYPVR